MELTTVTDGDAVFHDGTRVLRLEGLEPASEYAAHGQTFRTLPRPPGELLATIATVSDLHLGETECGVYAGVDLGPVMRSGPDEPPYPDTMSRAAAAEIAALNPDAVVAKGDLTSAGTPEELELFMTCFGARFGDRLHYVNGNHDVASGDRIEAPRMRVVDLPGVRLALLDTSVPGRSPGDLDSEQIEWLDDVGAEAASDGRPVLAFAHHPPDSASSPVGGIAPAASERLVEVFARRPALAGWFAGHTHRNRVHRLAATGAVPWAEVSATKDFPGAWAEYRVYEGGILQVVHRISSAEALDWTERTRAMFGGYYPGYAFGTLADRCFPVTLSAS
ncbi:MAG: metallophosphoesterase [Actinomycetota bacterium]|nr:metallophosphoesterase [Actinomycetota bacterium]